MRLTISCPPISDVFAYYTYIECIVRTALKDHEVQYNDPIFYRFNYNNITQFEDTLNNTDILMLSCYVWNWELQLALTDYARQVNPSIKIVAGGPQVHEPYYHLFDHVVKGEAEGAVVQIVEGTAPHIVTSIRKTDFEVSPYVENKEFLLSQKNEAAKRGMTLGVIFEANRGCPFACAFCDWGSATQSKVHYFDMDRVFNEIDFITDTLEPSFWFHADANFGITDRDLDISDHLVKAKQRSGYPKAFFYSVSKNTWQRNIQIAEKLWDGKLIDSYNVGVQHTDPEVLKVNKRGNIKSTYNKIVGQRLKEKNIPVNTQMILGMPGDTPDKWFDSLCETFEWGFHSELKVYWYNLLPNAPASEPSYKQLWQIKTKKVIYDQSRLLTDPNELIDRVSDIIVSTSTFSEDDWVTMNVETRWLQALHNFALVRQIAMYKRFIEGVPYNVFYRGLIDYISESLGKHFNDQYSNYLRELLDHGDGKTHVRFIFDDKMVRVEPEDVLFLYLLNNKEEFYRLVNQFVGDDDLVEYQKNIMLDLDYNPTQGRTIKLNYDYIKLFKDIEKASYVSKLNIPIEYHTNQDVIEGSTEFTKSRIIWHKANNNERKLNLFVKSVLGMIDFRGERTQLKHWTNVS